MIRKVIIFVASFFVIWIISEVHILMGPSKIQVVDENCNSTTNIVPENLSDCISMLNEMFDDQSREKILYYANDTKDHSNQLELIESDVFGHHGIGMAIRNDWGLWTDSSLKRWFSWRGIRHPEVISDYILDQYILHLREMPVENLTFYRFFILTFIAFFFTIILHLFRIITRKGQKDQSNYS